MKFKDGIVISEVGGERILVDAGVSGEQLHGVITLNESACFIANKLQSETTLENLAEDLVNEYDVDKATALSDAKSLVEKFKENNLIVE